MNDEGDCSDEDLENTFDDFLSEEEDSPEKEEDDEDEEEDKTVNSPEFRTINPLSLMKRKLHLIKDKSNKSIKHVFNECKKEEVDGDD